ncbi:pyocin activator PrtN family protein [Shewanella sp. MF05960]|uniref:pyocin activator PrtN family protein n=1 Tax=Shewanella TaxID=22 RepID=UPI003D7AFCCA
MKKDLKCNFTMTHHLLLSQFSNRLLIPIDELAEQYLGISVNTAKRKAKSNELPFPCFKMGMNQKSPYVVHLSELVKYIDIRTNEARALWTEYQYR